MNKKIFAILSAVIIVVGIFVLQKEQPKTDSENIYFFTKSYCPYCEEATAYIKKTHPDLDVIYVDISSPKNFDMFLSYATKYNLDKRYIGTPLICIGDNYLLGWSKESEETFDFYIKTYKK